MKRTIVAAVALVALLEPAGAETMQTLTLRPVMTIDDYLANADTISQWLDGGGPMESVLSAMPALHRNFVTAYFLGCLDRGLLQSNDSWRGMTGGMELYIAAIAGNDRPTEGGGTYWITKLRKESPCLPH
jgi:hypothetical protein